MAKSNWLIYGANGYTARLVIEQAIRRGHKPIIAGRTEAKIRPIAEQTGLDYIVFDLTDGHLLKKALSNVKLVFNAAGPFIHTSQKLIDACLKYRVNYTDITGEVPVFQNVFLYSKQAEQNGIVLMPGIGFDVIPSDCLAKYVANQVPNAVELDIAFTGLEHISPGTLKTMVEMIPGGGLIRRDGRLIPSHLGKGSKKVIFPDGEHTVVPIIWGDLETAYHSTGIPNITTYMAYPNFMVPFLPVGIPVMQRIFANNFAKRVVQRLIEIVVKGPDKAAREHRRAYVWASAKNSNGDQRQAWLDIPETYSFTAIAAVVSIEEILSVQPKGALTPAMAFGPDFVLKIEGVKRYDNLPAQNNK